MMQIEALMDVKTFGAQSGASTWAPKLKPGVVVKSTGTYLDLQSSKVTLNGTEHRCWHLSRSDSSDGSLSTAIQSDLDPRFRWKRPSLF
jgi:hypothetical protein